jgi:two-component system cell cycle sensor histidine kinase PleC
MMEQGIGGPLNERHRQYVEHIHSSGQHLLGIISDILDLSKIEAGQFKLRESEVALPLLAKTCVQMVEERARGKNLTLATEIDADLPLLFADPVRIKQILLNLLSNAIKFTEHGSVTLSMRFDSVEGFVLSVTDTGAGMTADELAVALEPFGQVEDAYCRNNEGTGLGLPIARHLVELHGGRLDLQSRKRVGTSAIATLPATRAAACAQEIGATA